MKFTEIVPVLALLTRSIASPGRCPRLLAGSDYLLIHHLTVKRQDDDCTETPATVVDPVTAPTSSGVPTYPGGYQPLPYSASSSTSSFSFGFSSGSRFGTYSSSSTSSTEGSPVTQANSTSAVGTSPSSSTSTQIVTLTLTLNSTSAVTVTPSLVSYTPPVYSGFSPSGPLSTGSSSSLPVFSNSSAGPFPTGTGSISSPNTAPGKQSIPRTCFKPRQC